MKYVALFALFILGCGTAFAGLLNSARFFTGVPTLDEVGLAALMGAVGAIGGWVAGRKSKKK